MSDDQPLHLYVVGMPYITSKTSFKEHVEYNYRASTHELRLFLRGLSQREIKDITESPCEFALYVEDDIIFLLYRFGQSIPWSDCPFSIHLVKEKLPEEYTLPEPAHISDPHDLLSVILVDADTGLIRGLRMVTFSPAFTTALRLAIYEQSKRPWVGNAEYDRQHASVYRKFPTSTDMVKVARARCTGGT